MSTFIALLRGINVSGQKSIKMAALKEILQANGLESVQTYVQSGNVIFDSLQSEPGQLAFNIENILKTSFGFDVSVLVKRPWDFHHILKHNPFLKYSEKDTAKMYVTFLFEVPAPEAIERLSEHSYPPEEYIIEKDIVYFYSPNGYGNAKMNNNFFENKLKVAATTRNWNSINKLAEMSGNKKP